MDGSSEKKALFPVGCILFLLIAAFAVCEYVFDMPIPWKQKNSVPDVTAEYRRTYIYKDRNCNYVLVLTYVFTNKGREAVSFDSCYESAASINGTALTRVYLDDEKGKSTDDEIQPGVIAAMQVGYELKDFTPGRSAKIRIKLTERFGAQNVIHQTEKNASELSVKEENPFCKVC